MEKLFWNIKWKGKNSEWLLVKTYHGKDRGGHHDGGDGEHGAGLHAGVAGDGGGLGYIGRVWVMSVISNTMFRVMSIITITLLG